MYKRMENLIDAVRKHPALWDITAKIYKDSSKRVEAWCAVSAECGLTQESAKSKWRGLRDTYIKFLKAQKRATEQGRKKRRKYCYAERMAFMKPLLSNLRSRVIVNESLDLSSVDVEKEETIAKEVAAPPPMVVYECEKEMESPPSKRLCQSFNSRNDYFESLQRNQNTSESQMDSTDMLFLSYSKNLKTMSKRMQILLKRKIAEVFADAELEELAQDETELMCSSYSRTIEANQSIADHEGITDPIACKIEQH